MTHAGRSQNAFVSVKESEEEEEEEEEGRKKEEEEEEEQSAQGVSAPVARSLLRLGRGRWLFFVVEGVIAKEVGPLLAMLHSENEHLDAAMS